MNAEVAQPYSLVLGLSSLTIITYFGSSAGQYQANEAIVLHTHFSYFHLVAICDVQVFHATLLYHSALAFHATHLLIEFTSILVIVSDVDFFITLLTVSGLYFTTFLFGYTI